MLNRDEVKEILLSNNPEIKIIYNDDEVEEITDGLCKDIEKVRKFMKEANVLIAELEISDPKLAKLLKDELYNFDDDDIW